MLPTRYQSPRHRFLCGMAYLISSKKSSPLSPIYLHTVGQNMGTPGNLSRSPWYQTLNTSWKLEPYLSWALITLHSFLYLHRRGDFWPMMCSTLVLLALDIVLINKTKGSIVWPGEERSRWSLDFVVTIASYLSRARELLLRASCIIHIIMSDKAGNQTIFNVFPSTMVTPIQGFDWGYNVVSVCMLFFESFYYFVQALAVTTGVSINCLKSTRPRELNSSPWDDDRLLKYHHQSSSSWID